MKYRNSIADYSSNRPNILNQADDLESWPFMHRSQEFFSPGQIPPLSLTGKCLASKIDGARLEIDQEYEKVIRYLDFALNKRRAQWCVNKFWSDISAVSLRVWPWCLIESECGHVDLV